MNNKLQPLILRSADTCASLVSFFDVVDIRAIKYCLDVMPEDWHDVFSEYLLRYIKRCIGITLLVESDGSTIMKNNGKTMQFFHNNVHVIKFTISDGTTMVKWENNVRR